MNLSRLLLFQHTHDGGPKCDTIKLRFLGSLMHAAVNATYSTITLSVMVDAIMPDMQ